jgi:hypothetical protein
VRSTGVRKWGFRRKKSLYELEKELVETKARFEIYKQTLMCQVSFNDRQREELMALSAKVKTLEFDRDKLKFDEIVKKEEKCQ